MNIYVPIVITEEIEHNFKPTRLAIKELNGLKYFCKSIRKNIETYTGSGIRWTNHIKKYGKKNVKTIWVSDWFYCPYYLQSFALMFSEYNQIVESNEWANLIPENGLTGNRGSKKGHMIGIPKPKSNQHKQAISNTLTGITLTERHGEEKANYIRKRMSASATGRKRTPDSIAKTVAIHTGAKRSKETINKLIECRKYYKKYTCEHCKKITGPGNYYRWHGDNCKNSNTILAEDDDTCAQSAKFF